MTTRPRLHDCVGAITRAEDKDGSLARDNGPSDREHNYSRLASVHEPLRPRGDPQRLALFMRHSPQLIVSRGRS